MSTGSGRRLDSLGLALALAVAAARRDLLVRHGRQAVGHDGLPAGLELETRTQANAR